MVHYMFDSLEWNMIEFLFNNDTNKCDSTQADAFDYDDFLYGM